MKRRFSLLLLSATMAVAAMAQPKVVAHRGFWNTEGSAQNSITALQKAAEIGCYGSEFDIWITADGVPVVNHDATIDGIRIEDTTFATLMNHRLKNGEFIPTLQHFLSEALKYPKCQLILEVKPHRNAERDEKATLMALKLVKELGLEARTEYISFSKNACACIHREMPNAKVAYLNGELSPAEVKALGWTGIDYNEKVFVEHPEWLKEAKKLGIEINVWTVNGEEGLRHHAAIPEIDIITTNDPDLLIKILKK